MKHIKLIAIFLCTLTLALGCKKNSPSNSNTGNYLTINEDKRDLGLIPSGDIEYENSSWSSPDQWQFIVYIENKCDNINGLKNNFVRIIFDIWDKDLTKTEYHISDDYQKIGTCNIRMDITGDNNLDIYLRASEGKVQITKNADGNLKSAKFTNVKMAGNNYTFTTSTSLTIGN